MRFNGTNELREPGHGTKQDACLIAGRASLADRQGLPSSAAGWRIGDGSPSRACYVAKNCGARCAELMWRQSNIGHDPGRCFRMKSGRRA